jgi:hypothetical protein
MLDFKKPISRKEFIKKVGIGLLAVPLLSTLVKADTLFKGDNFVKIGGTSSQFLMADGSVNSTSSNKTLQFFGDLTGMYAAGVTRWKFIDMERCASTFPSGVTITSIYVDCSTNDPTTELNANLKYCDAIAGGAFPGANQTLINALDTTTGNFSITDMSTSSLGSGVIPANKVLYFELDADPTDTSTTWSVIVNFTVN